MSFKTIVWNIPKLVELYNSDALNLNPPYQRNAIWSVQAQKLLIDTIKKDMPLPAFFIQDKGDNKYEMVDGQQRTRALLSYTKGDFEYPTGEKFRKDEFKDYQVAVNILSKDLTIEQVREFYVRVNRSGAKLERPELNKAEYFDTSFLKLVTELCDLQYFTELNLFTPSVKKRMFDRDFIEELVALYLFGSNDKKKAVDNLFKEDINEEKYLKIKKEFTSLIKTISEINKTTPISDTRFSQKNDFYTLFSIIKRIQSEEKITQLKLFNNLVIISKGISPSNEECKILMEYANNCITQSNSKKAREKRFKILEKLILNESENPNKEQKDVANYFGIEPMLEKVSKYRILKF